LKRWTDFGEFEEDFKNDDWQAIAFDRYIQWKKNENEDQNWGWELNGTLNNI
jgi:hypothetical protein